jgi:vitamin B12 transporter
MAAPVGLDAYTTLDLYTEYKLGKILKAYADLKNITNKQYFDILGYASRRFNFMAGISLNL